MGKVVRFQILYTVTSPAGKTTEYGRALLSPTGPHLPELLLENGWVKLRDNAGHNEQTEEAKVQLEKLRVLEAKAKSNGAGLWKSSSDYARTQYDLQNPQAFLEQWKSQVVDGMILPPTLPLLITGDERLGSLFPSHRRESFGRRSSDRPVGLATRQASAMSHHHRGHPCADDETDKHC